MRVDPEVSRLKFHREIETLHRQRAVLESRGVFLLASADYPFVNLFFAPRHPLRIALPGAQPPGATLPEGTVLTVDVPSLAARPFRARFDLTDYDLRAPSIEFYDPWSGDLLEYPTMFRALEFEKARRQHLVLLGDHPTTHKPFLCLRGVREYHEHPQHSGDDWLLYRSEMSLFALIVSLWRVSIDLVHPILIPQPAGLQVQWVAEEKA